MWPLEVSYSPISLARYDDDEENMEDYDGFEEDEEYDEDYDEDDEDEDDDYEEYEEEFDDEDEPRPSRRRGDWD